MSATTPGAATCSSLPSERAEARPLAGRQPAGPMHDGAPLTIDLPPSVRAVLARLADDGLEAALVGGSVRDLVTGATPTDWDVATAAPPERVAALFPGSSWENRFGTVTVRGDPDVRGHHLPPRRPVPRPPPAGARALGNIAGRRPRTPRLHRQRHRLATSRPGRGRGHAGRPVRRDRRPAARGAAGGGGSGRTLRRGRPAHGASGALRDAAGPGAGSGDRGGDRRPRR